MKKVLYLFVAILIVFLGLSVWGGMWIKKNTVLSISDFFGKDGEVDLSDEARGEIKNGAKELDYKIYKEATEHNPEGDMLPDEIDDTIREKLKEEIKKELQEETKNKINEN